MKKQTLTTGQIAKYCRVNYQTVIRWIKRGRMKAHQLPGRGDHRVEVADFLDFLKNHKLPVPEEFEQRAKRVLIVDDDPDIVKLMQRMLRAKGYETASASNGFEAGALLGTYEPQLVTLDLEMPGLGGLDVIKFMRSSPHYKRIQVLVVSGMPQDELDTALEAGADGVLEKPFKKDVLITKIWELIG